MNTPFFSIIIPVFNRQDFILVAIDSVIMQSFTNWELIIVDDGSTDDTAKVIKSIDDSRIRYVYQENQERSVARNNGIKIAEGEYICFLDSDDYYESDYLNSFRIAISELDVKESFLFCDFKLMQGENITSYHYDKPKNLSPIEEVFLASLGAPRVCLHRSLMINNSFNPNTRVGEDLELWCSILKNGHPIKYINKNSLVIVDHDNRSINQDDLYIMKKNEELIKNLRLKYKGIISKDVLNHKLSLHYLHWSYKSGFCLTSIKLIIKSLLYDYKNRRKEKIYVFIKCVLSFRW